jgi:small-conductance mechanosensitive channel
MKDILDTFGNYAFLGNGPAVWVGSVGIGIVSYLVLKWFFYIVKNRVQALSRAKTLFAYKIVAAALESTQGWFLFAFSVWIGARILDRSEFNGLIDFSVILAVTLQIALWANRVVTAYVEFFSVSQREENPGLVSAAQGLSFIVRLAIWAVALLLIIDNLGYDVNALIAGLGIGGIAIALAVQNVLSDLFASLSILLDKPFVVGDFIIVGELLGVVERVGIKTTRVKSLSGEQLIFSNSDLLNSRIRNFKRMEERRVAFTFGVLYQTTPEQLEAIPLMVRDLINGIENTRFDRAHFKSFGASSYDFEVVYYIGTPDYNEYMDTQQKINLGICRKFEEMGIEFAYPTRTIYVNQVDKEDSRAPEMQAYSTTRHADD